MIGLLLMKPSIPKEKISPTCSLTHMQSCNHAINNAPTHYINAPFVPLVASMVKIDVYDFDDHTSHDLIGCFTATVAELKSRVTNGAKLSKAQQVRTDRTFLAPENLGRL